MPRPEKVQAVAEIKERIDRARAVFLAEYAGLSVSQQQSLRRGLKEQEAEFKVVKMSLARRAVAELEIDTLDELLLGPTGLTYADGDPVGAAKTLEEFAKAHDAFEIKGGLLADEFLTPERVGQLAAIEPRDVLLAKLAGLFAAPMSEVAGLLEALQREMAGLLAALITEREATGEGEEAVPAAETEPVADDATAHPEDDPEADAVAEPATEVADDTRADATAGETEDGQGDPDEAASGDAPVTEDQPDDAEEA